jgi:hypothetical protein
MSDKIPLYYTPKALTPEEREFATALGHEVSRALAVAAAHPEMSFPAGSLANRVQKSCRKMLTGPKAAAAQARAAKLLKADVATRQKYFGNAAKPGSDAQAVAAAGTDLSAVLKTKLTKAVNARLMSKDQASIHALAENLRQINLKGLLTRTKVETGHFLGDVVTEGTNTVGLLAPEKLEFRWSTTEVGANAGKWQLVKKLVQVGQHHARQPVLATGETGAPGSIFTIDLPKWLPPQPPPTGAEFYEVRVAAYKHTPSGTSLQRVGATASQMLGAWSPPVTIKYFKSDTPFHFEGANVLRSLAGQLTDIEMSIDSNESGGEEFHIAGFLSETRSDGSNTSWDFVFYQELDIDTKKKGFLGNIGPKDGWEIDLGDPDDESWPKVYTLFVSVMEQDHGDVAPWFKELYGEVKEFVLDLVWTEMKKVLSELKAAGKVALAAAVAGTAIAEVATATAAEIAAILSAACAVLWVLVAVVVAIVVIGEIIEGVDNDSYGSNGAVLVLPMNLYDYFNQVSGEYKSEGNDHGFEIRGGMFFNIEPSGIFADQGQISIGTRFLLHNFDFWVPK